MKKLLTLPLLIALAACAKPVDRPAAAKKGEPAPQVTLEKMVRGDLKPVKGWDDLKGKAVVMEFWATWCEPCRDNIPHMNGLAEKFKDKPVVFLSVTKEKQEVVEEFLKTQEMKGNVAVDAAAAFKSFGVRGIPHTVLIDKNSVVKAFTYPTYVTEQVIEDLLAGKEAEVKDTARREEPPPPAGAADAAAFFAVSPSTRGPSMTMSDTELSLDGITLKYAIETAMRSAHGVDFKDVPQDLLYGSYRLAAKVDAKALAAGGEPLRDLILAGLNGAFPFRAAVVKRDRKALVLKKAGALKLEAHTGKGGSRNTSNDEKAASITAKGAVMDDLAQELEGWLKTPVLDETGLGEARYNFSVKAEPVDLKTVNAALAPLGLKLAEARRVVEIVEVTGRKAAQLAAKH